MRYHSSGCYEEVTEVAAGHVGTAAAASAAMTAAATTRKVRHCNWVRFLRPSPLFTPHVNVVCSKIKGDFFFPFYRCRRPKAQKGNERGAYYQPWEDAMTCYRMACGTRIWQSGFLFVKLNLVNRAERACSRSCVMSWQMKKEGKKRKNGSLSPLQKVDTNRSLRLPFH